MERSRDFLMDSLDSSLSELSSQLPQEILDDAFHSFAQAVTPHVMLYWSGAECPRLSLLAQSPLSSLPLTLYEKSNGFLVPIQDHKQHKCVYAGSGFGGYYLRL